ncbi:TIGR01777 family oxidoreductase [Zhongshania borealis]|uniref:TIGR01777 family oxidoreductase n=1 Tax=Zhongshania borealis TaxID=889488 RepID=A0ABP7WTR2_9GAMM
MNVLITGGTGFIGSALCNHLHQEGHRLIVKTRHPELVDSRMTAVSDLSELPAKDSIDAVINLAGESIAGKRWSAAQKQKIVASRIKTTEELIRFLEGLESKPSVLISASAIGVYGVGVTDDSIDESCTGDASFSSCLCAQWEACAMRAEGLGIRTCILRIGIVIGPGGGALAKMIPPFKLGLGGRIGSGKQWMSWIHLRDLISIIDLCITDMCFQGPINCTAPNPVTNREFTHVLGQCLKRPSRLPMPSFLVKLLLGEMGSELLLAGKQVRPAKLESLGFSFQFERLEPALLNVI